MGVYSDKKCACWGLCLRYLSVLFLIHSSELLLMSYEGSLFHLFTMQFKKKGLASSDLKRLGVILNLLFLVRFK